MSGPKASVVIGTWNRAHLLWRSLECWARQTERDFELIILDNDSTDNTYALVREWQRKLDIKYVALRQRDGEAKWLDVAGYLNIGLRMAKGEVVFATQAEYMPGFATIEKGCAAAIDDLYIACKPYYLTASQQEKLDMLPWRKEGPIAVRKLNPFYGVSAMDTPGYRPEDIEAAQDWPSWMFGGMTRATWRRIGGMSEHRYWGSVDNTFMERRAMLRIDIHTLQDDDTYGVHQNHDDLNAGRRPDLIAEDSKVIRTPEDAMEDNL